MRVIPLPLSSLPGKDSFDLLISKEPGEFGSLLSDHPGANSVAKVHKQLNTFRMLRGCEQCDSWRVESMMCSVALTAIPVYILFMNQLTHSLCILCY